MTKTFSFIILLFVLFHFLIPFAYAQVTPTAKNTTPTPVQDILSKNDLLVTVATTPLPSETIAPTAAPVLVTPTVAVTPVITVTPTPSILPTPTPEEVTAIATGSAVSLVSPTITPEVTTKPVNTPTPTVVITPTPTIKLLPNLVKNNPVAKAVAQVIAPDHIFPASFLQFEKTERQYYPSTQLSLTTTQGLLLLAFLSIFFGFLLIFWERFFPAKEPKDILAKSFL